MTKLLYTGDSVDKLIACLEARALQLSARQDLNDEQKGYLKCLEDCLDLVMMGLIVHQ